MSREHRGAGFLTPNKGRMQTTNLALTGSIVLVMGVLLSACGPDSPAESFDAAATGSNRGQAYVVDDVSEKNILQVAMASPDHSTLAAAVEAASMENVLVNAGPLTVFAPTNAAFEALPDGTVETLLKPENKSKLAAIITSHAAPGVFKGKLLEDGTQIYQASGHYVPVEVRDGKTYVNGAEILATVEATNGVVHVVDKVFLLVDG